MTAVLEARLAYAAHNWQTVPLNWPTPVGCSCQRGAQCPSPAKHPWVKWRDAGGTVDPDLIAWQQRRRPMSGVAVLTGNARSGLFILDVDQGGQDTLERLQDVNGELPPTLEATTGSDGTHLVFSVTGPSPTDAGQLGPHLDRRGDGGLVVFSPSRHRSGKHYRIRNPGTPIAPAPAWILCSVRPARTISPADRVAAMHATGDDLLDRAAQAIADAPVGQRHHTIVRAAWSIAALVIAGRVDEQTARRALLDAADRAGYDTSKSGDAIDSAFAKRSGRAA